MLWETPTLLAIPCLQLPCLQFLAHNLPCLQFPAHNLPCLQFLAHNSLVTTALIAIPWLQLPCLQFPACSSLLAIEAEAGKGWQKRGFGLPTGG